MTNKREDLSLLVVDDMKFSCEYVRRALSQEGYTDIRVAGSAFEALDLMQERPVDVMIADWVMPEMDGLELAERVRQIDEENHRYTCVVVLTAKDDIGSVIEAFDRGVDDYLTKPPNKQEMAARIYAAGRIAMLQNSLFEAMSLMQVQHQQKHLLDDLTGLGNRNEAIRRLNELLQLVNSRGGGVCCALLRLQRTEEIVQRYGQSGYEELLARLSLRLRRAVRPGDLLARINDTDFVIGMYFADESLIRVRNFKRILQGVNLRPIKGSMGFVRLPAAMGLACNRSNDPLIFANTLLNSASDKVIFSVKTGCHEVGA